MQAQFLKERYRIAWHDPLTKEIGRGDFMFDGPDDAVETKSQLQKSFPMDDIWLEDVKGQRIEIPDGG